MFIAVKAIGLLMKDATADFDFKNTRDLQLY